MSVDLSRLDGAALDSPKAVERAPMWSRFFRESGVDATTLWRDRSPAIVDRSSWAINVFCVEEAPGSPGIPDQHEFVQRYGIQSVFGFCGRLRRGDLFVLVLFSRAAVTRDVAARLRPLALDLTSTFFRFADDEVFASTPAAARGGRSTEATGPRS